MVLDSDRLTRVFSIAIVGSLKLGRRNPGKTPMPRRKLRLKTLNNELRLTCLQCALVRRYNQVRSGRGFGVPVPTVQSANDAFNRSDGLAFFKYQIVDRRLVNANVIPLKSMP